MQCKSRAGIDRKGYRGESERNLLSHSCIRNCTGKLIFLRTIYSCIASRNIEYRKCTGFFIAETEVFFLSVKSNAESVIAVFCNLKQVGNIITVWIPDLRGKCDIVDFREVIGQSQCTFKSFPAGDGSLGKFHFDMGTDTIFFFGRGWEHCGITDQTAVRSSWCCIRVPNVFGGTMFCVTGNSWYCRHTWDHRYTSSIDLVWRQKRTFRVIVIGWSIRCFIAEITTIWCWKPHFLPPGFHSVTNNLITSQQTFCTINFFYVDLN